MLSFTSTSSISSLLVGRNHHENWCRVRLISLETGPKASSMLALVKSLKKEGVPVDGIGFQSHFIVGEVPTSMSTVMEQMTALGVEVR